MVMTHSGATLSKMIRIQLHRFHFSDITKDVVVATRVCAKLYTSVVVCYFWEPCLLLAFKPTGNGKWFAILKTYAEVRQFEDASLQWARVSLQQRDNKQ